MMRGMAVLGLYALQNGFMGFERSGLFYDEFSGDRVRIPIACWLVRPSDSMILFDTGLSPRAVPGLLRNDPLARFTEEDLLIHRLDLVGLEPDNVDMVVLSHLHYDHAGGAALFPKSELIAQKDEYSYAHYPSSFFESFYYRKNFELPGYRWRLLDGDTELLPGVTILRSDGHTPGHQSLLVELPESGPVILTGDACYWHEHADKERVPGVVWNPTLALHSLRSPQAGRGRPDDHRRPPDFRHGPPAVPKARPQQRAAEHAALVRLAPVRHRSARLRGRSRLRPRRPGDGHGDGRRRHRGQLPDRRARAARPRQHGSADVPGHQPRLQQLDPRVLLVQPGPAEVGRDAARSRRASGLP